MKFLAFLKPKDKNRAISSDFSRFIREASSGEKKRVYMDVAKKASEEQRKVIQEYREMVTQ